VCAQGNLVHIQEKVPTREQFPLPTLGPKLEAFREEVRIGRGFQLLRRVHIRILQKIMCTCQTQDMWECIGIAQAVRHAEGSASVQGSAS
jgi:hypothetical protein